MRKLINFLVSLFKAKEKEYTNTTPIVLNPPVNIPVDKWWANLPQMIPGVDMWADCADKPWIKWMAQFYGEKEYAGKDKNNSKITNLFKIVKGKVYPDETMWCKAAVGASLIETDYDEGLVEGSLWAADGKHIGDACGEEPGCIVGFYSAAANSGIHIAFAIFWTSTHVWAFGGNQNNMFCVQKRDKRDVRFKRMPKKKA